MGALNNSSTAVSAVFSLSRTPAGRLCYGYRSAAYWIYERNVYHFVRQRLGLDRFALTFLVMRLRKLRR